MRIEDVCLIFKILRLLLSFLPGWHVCLGVYDENAQWVCLFLYFILLNWSSD